MYFIFILMALAIIIIILSVNASCSKSTSAKKKAPDRLMQNKTDVNVLTDVMDREVRELYISGLAHHCTRDDIGLFNGSVFNEKDNPVDKTAMAIRNNHTHHIVGYIPSAVLADYHNWSKRETKYCVGYIFWDGEHLRGRVRVYPSIDDDCKNRVEEDATRYSQIVAEHFGWKFNK